MAKLIGFLIISILIFPSIYIKSYVQRLLKQGYKVKTVVNGDLDSVRAQWGINLTESVHFLRKCT